MKKDYEILRKEFVEKIEKAGVNIEHAYYKLREHHTTRTPKNRISESNADDMIRNWVNWEMENRCYKDEDAEGNEILICKNLDDSIIVIDDDDDNFIKFSEKLFEDFENELNEIGKINVGDYDILKVSYIRVDDVEKLIFGDGFLAEDFEKYLKENNIELSNWDNTDVSEFFDEFGIEIW